MKKKKTVFTLYILFTVAGALVFGFSDLTEAWDDCFLVLSDIPETNSIKIPVKTGDQFILDYFHSYSKFPVHEHYRITKDKQIKLHKIIQRAVQCSDMIFSNVKLRDDGWMEVSDINRITSETGFISGSPDLGNHRLRVGDNEWVISDYFDGGSNMILKIESYEKKLY